MRLCRVGEDLANMGLWSDTLEAGDDGQRNFRSDSCSGSEAAHDPESPWRLSNRSVLGVE